MKHNQLTHEIIGAAMEVHRELGPGKPEPSYESALAFELSLRGIPHQTQRPVPVVYKAVKLECGYRLDLLAANTVVGEIKSVETVHPVHRAQVLSYLKLGGWKIALLLNFNVAVLKDGIERFVLGLEERGTESERPPTLKQTISSSHVLPSLHRTANSGDAVAEGLAGEVLAAAAAVHRELGPGLLASAYEACLCHELHLRGVPFERKAQLALNYKGNLLPQADQIELLVGGRVVVKPRAMLAIESVHEAELLSQLRLGGWGLGLLVNFNSIRLADGIRRIVLTGTRGRRTADLPLPGV